MENEKIFAMSFAKVYPMLIAKAERKGRTKDEVFQVTQWLIKGSICGVKVELIEDPLIPNLNGSNCRGAAAAVQ